MVYFYIIFDYYDIIIKLIIEIKEFINEFDRDFSYTGTNEWTIINDKKSDGI